MVVLSRLRSVGEWGQNVQIAMIRKGWRQRDLAAALGCWPQNVSITLRSRRPALETVERYASVLEVKPETLDPTYPIRKGIYDVIARRKAAGDAAKRAAAAAAGEVHG